MEKRNTVIQELKKSLEDEYAVAQKYYSILSAINNLNLTKREIELIAFTAVKGTISYANSRAQFCEKYNTTTATINNIVSKLKKVGIFVKHLGKIKVNPIIVIDFKKNLNLVIRLVHNEEVKTVLKGSSYKEDVTKLIVSEIVLNQVIAHQFNSAHDALKNNNSVEISGYGKFLFNKKKAKTKVKSLEKVKESYEKILTEDDISLKRSNFIKSKLSSINLTLNSLKPKIKEDETI